MARGIERRDIFDSDADRRQFLDRVDTVARKTSVRIFAWSLMPNYIHLLVRTATTSISRAMHRLLGGYASYFNRTHRRCGHLFQNRFKSILVEEKPYLLELVRYIHLNPVRAGVVATLDDLDTYPWTGHHALLGKASVGWQYTEPVLALFGTHAGSARRAYNDFVATGFAQGRRPELSTGIVLRSLGRRVVKALRRGREFWASDERVLGSEDFVLQVLGERFGRPHQTACPDDQLQRLLDVVAARCGLSPAEIAGNSSRRAVVQARAIVSVLAVGRLGVPLSRVARTLNVSPQTVLRGVDVAPRVLEHRRWAADTFGA